MQWDNALHINCSLLNEARQHVSERRVGLLESMCTVLKKLLHVYDSTWNIVEVVG